MRRWTILVFCLFAIYLLLGSHWNVAAAVVFMSITMLLMDISDTLLEIYQDQQAKNNE